jgi:Lysine methyltransferase
MNEKSNDEDEGRITRHLFHTDSDDEEDSWHSGDEKEGCRARRVVQRTYIYNIELQEQVVGGSIAQRLWPAAEYLTRFVVEAFHPEGLQSLSMSRNGSAEFEGLQNLLLSSSSSPLLLLELGAGLGLTGMAIAAQIVENQGKVCRVLATDLEEGLPMLKANIQLNQHRWNCQSTVTSGENNDLEGNELKSSLRGVSCVEAQRLLWGTKPDCELALDWLYPERIEQQKLEEQPLLILGSDCVYWEQLHVPLIQTLTSLLSQSPPGSMCLLAGMRRWKRDNTFYFRTISKASKGQLRCTCLREEKIQSLTPSQQDGDINQNELSRREVIRVFSVRWVPPLESTLQRAPRTKIDEQT